MFTGLVEIGDQMNEIEKYLDEKDNKRKRNTKYKIFGVIVLVTSVIVFIFIKSPEKEEFQVSFKNGIDEIKVDVTAGDKLESVLSSNKLSSQNIYYINGEIVTFKQLQNYKVKNNISITYVKVTFKEINDKIEINFDTKKVDDPTLEIGTEVVSIKGEIGLREIKTKITLHDGIEVAREVKEKVLKSPQNEVVTVGTKTNTNGNNSSNENGTTNGSNPQESSDSSNGSSGSTNDFEIQIR